MLGWIVFLPGGFWERLGSIFPKWNLMPWLEKPPLRWICSGLAKRPVRIKSHWVTNSLALGIIGYVLLLNFATTSIEKFRPVFIQKQKWFGRLLGIDQSWAMFAPDPLFENWWYVIPGQLRDGTEVELHGGEIPLRWEKPKDVSVAIPNVKWRKYFNWLPKKRYQVFLPYYGSYLCQEWNASAPKGKELESLQIYYLHETVMPDFRRSEAEKSLLWKQACGTTPESLKSSN